MAKNKLNDLGKPETIKKLLDFSKRFAILSVVVLVISIILLVLTGVLKLYIIFRDLIFTSRDEYTEVDVDVLSAQLLGIVDIYVLAVVLYIFTTAIYQLFIGRVTTHPWLKIDNMDDLKSNLAKMMILFLSTFIVEKIVEWEDPVKIMYFGVVIVIVCLMLIWYSTFLTKRSKEKNGG